MTEPVSLELAKQHLNVDISDDDLLIELYIVAARENAENYLNRTIPWLDDASPPAPVAVPSAIIVALLLDIGDMYENREAQVMAVTLNQNKAWIAKLTPYRLCMGV